MKKKHLTVICGVFLPEPSPTGLCAKRFIELLDERFEIDIICISPFGTDKITKDEAGHTVYMLTGFRKGKEDRAGGAKKKLWHRLGALEIKLFLLGNLKWYENAVYERLKAIHAKKTIDTVFSICSPFAAHVGAYRFKKANPAVRWCAYTVDPYSTQNRIRPFWCSLKRLTSYERRILENVDHLLLSDEVYNTRPELITDQEKTEALPYILPAFAFHKTEKPLFDPKDVNCVYAGRFYEDIRNPERMLQTFAAMSDPQIKLHLFSVGCEKTVNKYASQTDRIILHELVPHDQISTVYGEADVLIMVANKAEEFLPSKVFEYIATGKPIVCFDNQRNNEGILYRYPYKLVVGRTMDVIEIEDFLRRNKGAIASRREIENNYFNHSPKTVQALLMDSMD